MIRQSIAKAFDSLETITIPGPWPGASGETWELLISSALADGFLTALESEGVKPRGILERSEEASEDRPVDSSDLVAEAAFSLGSKKAKAKAVKEAMKRDRRAKEEAAERLKVAERERREIVEIGYDLANYPDRILSLGEIESILPAVRDLVRHAYVVNGENRQDVIEDVETWFDDASPVPMAAKIGDDVEALYLGGRPQGLALAAWIYRHAVQEHLFWEARGPLGSASGSPPQKRPTGARKAASAGSKRQG